MVQLLTTAGTPRERPFKRNKCHRPKSFIQKYRPCKVESLNTRFKCVTLLQIGSYNLDLTGAQKLPGPSSALPTEVSTSTWDPWASKTGRFGGCTHQLPRVSEALAEHSLSDLCSTSRGFQMSQRPSQLRTLGENEIIYVWWILEKILKKKNGLLYTPICKQTPKVNGKQVYANKTSNIWTAPPCTLHFFRW